MPSFSSFPPISKLSMWGFLFIFCKIKFSRKRAWVVTSVNTISSKMEKRSILENKKKQERKWICPILMLTCECVRCDGFERLETNIFCLLLGG